LIVLSITGLRNLETLFLDSNDFKESVLIESLGALPSLESLDASYSNFTHFGKGQWQFWFLKQYDIYNISLNLHAMGSKFKHDIYLYIDGFIWSVPQGCVIRLALKKCGSMVLLISQQAFLGTLDPCLLLKSYPWAELTSIAPYLLKVILQKNNYKSIEIQITVVH